MQQHPPPSLFPREWLLILGTSSILLFFALIGLLFPDPLIPEDPLPKTITATIRGAVASPGTYELPLGAATADILALAAPLENADLSRIKLAEPLQQGKLLNIKEKPKITVYLEGAVTFEGPIEVPKGTRLADLAELAPLTLSADKKSLNRRRKLKNGETIHIPEQK